MNMGDYKKINVSHRLSSYEIRMPFWHGALSTRQPFLPWGAGASLPWYQAYNATKHDRHQSFHLATFKQMIDAMGGLVILLSSQSYTEDFSPRESLLALSEAAPDGLEASIGGYLRIRFPDDWPADQRYDFDWQQLESEPDPFQEFDYSKV